MKKTLCALLLTVFCGAAAAATPASDEKLDEVIAKLEVVRAERAANDVVALASADALAVQNVKIIFLLQCCALVLGIMWGGLTWYLWCYSIRDREFL